MLISESKLRKMIRSIIVEQQMKKLITKKDGTQRVMNFVRSKDIKHLSPEQLVQFGIPQMDPSRLVQDRPNAKTLQPGYETVWDLDAQGWRIINMDTVQDV